MFRRKFKSKRKIRKKSILLRRWFLVSLIFCGCIGLLCLFLAWRFTEKHRERAKEYDLTRINDIELPSLILDRKGFEVGRMFVENRHVISIEEIPQKMVDALVAGEDSRFYDHDGVDYIGVARAFYLNFKAGRQTQGASTVTQQLARNAFPLREKALELGESGYDRKIVEAFLARRIEQHYSKHEILEFYLNRVPFGSGYYGVRSAALGYFGKEPKDLDTQECASLVGCIKNPSTFSPLASLENNKKARDHVLNRMRIEHIISSVECERLKALPVEVSPEPIRRGTSHFYDKVANFVKDKVDSEVLSRGDLRIFTTVDQRAQSALEQGLQSQLSQIESREDYAHPKYSQYQASEGERPNYLQGAAMMIDHTNGEVLGYVGGRDFSHSQYDFIQSGKRPLGTAFFPFVYASAIENGVSLGAPQIDEAMDNRAVMVDGVEGVLGEWGAEIMQPKYEGVVTTRRAFAGSKVAATVRLARQLGLEKVSETAVRMGVKRPSEKLLPRFIVGAEDASLKDMVLSYSAFSNQGKMQKDLVWVTRIERGDGTLVYQHSGKTSPANVLHETTAYLMNSLMRSALKEGTGQRVIKDSELASDETLGGYNGTTFNFSNHWYVGSNHRITCGVWAGFWDGNEPIYSAAFSSDTVQPVWLDAMEQVSDLYKAETRTAPEAIEEVRICRHSGKRETPDCQHYTVNKVTGEEVYTKTGYQELFVKGLAPREFCPIHGSGGIVDESVFASSGGLIGARARSVASVQPARPTLVGQDPYNAYKPAFVKRQARPEAAERGIGAINVDQLDEVDESVQIRLELPTRVEIFD